MSGVVQGSRGLWGRGSPLGLGGPEAGPLRGPSRGLSVGPYADPSGGPYVGPSGGPYVGLSEGPSGGRADPWGLWGPFRPLGLCSMGRRACSRVGVTGRSMGRWVVHGHMVL